LTAARQTNAFMLKFTKFKNHLNYKIVRRISMMSYTDVLNLGHIA